MKIAIAASLLHKWLALLVGVQMLFWVVSGLFFALYPIERVRSEHRIAAQHVALDPAQLRAPATFMSLLPARPTRLTYETTSDGVPVAVSEFANHRPVTIDLRQQRVMSPLSSAAAVSIARAHVVSAPPVRETRLVMAETPEYRGALPAWRVALADAEGLVVFVAADTGRVTARRSDLWRVYDALWSLHIMDWRDHENFNTGLLMLTSFTALIVTLAGFILFPFRLKLPATRTRR